MILDTEHILPRMINSLWKLANTAPDKTRGNIESQKAALRLLLEVRGGIDFVVVKPKEELDELARRGIWAGMIIPQELAGLELTRRRLLADVADIDQQMREIVSEPTRITPCRCGRTHLPEESPHQTR